LQLNARDPNQQTEGGGNEEPMVRTQVIPVDLEQWVMNSINACRARLEREGVQLAPQGEPLTVHKALEASWDVLQAEARGVSWVEGVLQRSVEALDGLVVEDLDLRVPSADQMMGEATGEAADEEGQDGQPLARSFVRPLTLCCVCQVGLCRRTSLPWRRWTTC
jgi:hypothetical protein